jgi:chromosome partitioning protein
MGKTIAVINQKGGVGKTTTAVNVGTYLAEIGRTVLVVDFDPQGNATSGLGLDKNDLGTSAYEVLLDPAILVDAIHETRTPNLFLLPANSSLAAAEVELVNSPMREFRLKQSLQLAHYDYIIIDCPPALGLLTINTLAAANYAIIPVQAEYYALEGLGQLLSVIQRVRETVNPDLELLGIILTMYDKRISLADQVMTELKKHFKDKLFQTVIPRNVRLAEAPGFGLSIFDHDKWSKGARAYKQLAKEIESYVRKTD